MRIGVVSDTHNNLKNVRTIVDLFNDADLDAIVHTGDITQAKTIDVFADLAAPMFGVYGNNDEERETLERAIGECGFNFVEPPLVLNWHSQSIVVVHDPLEFNGVLDPSFDLALHGHTHLYRSERVVRTDRREQLIFNPGECAGHMTGYNAVGVVDLAAMETKLLKF